jgi:hypothetical protein
VRCESALTFTRAYAHCRCISLIPQCRDDAPVTLSLMTSVISQVLYS